ncbi:DUF1365 domain-containing protein [uncultured Microbulbifer sp.]|uniref:DUF1365 domain-containing protein n=1 Tax=uncultured Microbulbifer sp. TaxID=348147 RepID=UPI0025FC4182|nr:DUF1365 domain-containing protein [uncultured Microbulbifer sp.]
MNVNLPLRSAIYSGWVQHRRFTPRRNCFRYRVFMLYLDLAELERVLALSRLWSSAPGAPARFCRSDFFGDPEIGLDEAVRQRVEREFGVRPAGPICMLANWRYFGFNMNPISVYYCFDTSGEEVRWLLLDVHNTPWNERHGYVLDCRNSCRVQRAEFSKAMHVSPFMAMEQSYSWRSTTPAEHLSIYLKNIEGGDRILDATLSLSRQELTAESMRRVLIQYPLMTVKVVAAIYWQALKLWLKRVPVVNHPRRDVRAESGENRG